MIFLSFVMAGMAVLSALCLLMSLLTGNVAGMFYYGVATILSGATSRAFFEK